MDTRVGLGLSSNRAVEQHLLLLEKNDIARCWPRIEVALDADPSLWNSAWTKDDLLAKALSGDVQVWCVQLGDEFTMLLMTQLWPTFNEKYLQIFWAYGEDLESALELLSDVFDKFAAQHGAGQIEIVGRKGFERLLRPFGFEHMYTSYRRDVKLQRSN